MKRKLLLGSVLFSSLAFAQVGINTPTPAGTLDITAKNATGTAVNVDGLLIPRVDRQRAQSMTGVPTSTLVYINDVSTGDKTGTTLNVDTVGHYFYNGTAWMKLNTSGGAPLATNIYTSDGTLNSNRVVSQVTNKLQFNSSTKNGVFTIDAANNRIGVNTAAPGGIIDIVADNAGNGAGNDIYFTGFGTSDDPAIFLGSAGGTLAAPAALAPGAKVASIYFNPRLSTGWPFTSASFTSYYKGDGTTNLTDLRFSTSQAERVIIDETGKVGIGTITPTNTIDINGTARVRTLNQVAAGTVVTPVYSDANGVLVKASPSIAYAGVSSNTVTVASGATGTLITGMIDGAIYKAFVTVGDGCANVSVAEFFIINNSVNSNFSIKGSDGLLSYSATKAPTFAETNSTTTTVTWTGKPGCSAGDNSTSFNYTLTMPSAGTINITNNGNISKGYGITLTRVN